MDNAKVSYERLRNILPRESRWSFEDIKHVRTMVLVELGKGPKKFRTGPGDSLVEWASYRYPERQATLDIDGKEVASSITVDDLSYQARSADRAGKTALQATKGVLREGAAVTSVIALNEAANHQNKTAGWVALGTGLFALANQSQADIRQWELLPDRFGVIATLKPGDAERHQYITRFYSHFQNHLPSYDQVWYDQRDIDQDKIYIAQANVCQRH